MDMRVARESKECPVLEKKIKYHHIKDECLKSKCPTSVAVRHAYDIGQATLHYLVFQYQWLLRYPFFFICIPLLMLSS